MKANVKVTLKPQEFPAGTQQGLFRFRVVKKASGDAAHVEETGGVEVVTVVLQPDNYVAIVEALDTANPPNVLGTAQVEFAIAAPQPVTLSVPASVAVELIP